MPTAPPTTKKPTERRRNGVDTIVSAAVPTHENTEVLIVVREARNSERAVVVAV